MEKFIPFICGYDYPSSEYVHAKWIRSEEEWSEESQINPNAGDGARICWDSVAEAEAYGNKVSKEVYITR